VNCSSINQRFDTRPLETFHVYGHSVEVNMPINLELDCRNLQIPPILNSVQRSSFLVLLVINRVIPNPVV
jgi:hypothetical protein